MEQLKNVLIKYIPASFVDDFCILLAKYDVHFKIVKPRKTKLGDFRIVPKQRPVITVNGNLNQYAFLITGIHEIAHLHTYLNFGNRVKPHGKEWQKSYTALLHPFIKTGNFPEDIENALMQSLVNVKASSCTDQQLHRVLLKYDNLQHGFTVLEELPKNSTFAIENKTFLKGNKRRTRYLCEDIDSGKQYLVNGLAQVRIISDEK